MKILLQFIDDRQIDVFPGQEMNKSTLTQLFKKIRKHIQRCKNHIVTSETKWLFTSERRQGGTFCITSNKMRNSIQRNKPKVIKIYIHNPIC